jgi:hypothetical protein
MRCENLSQRAYQMCSNCCTRSIPVPVRDLNATPVIESDTVRTISKIELEHSQSNTSSHRANHRHRVNT